ncbi:MAG: DUF5683 domain-containing protein [Bacteroidota bacterium]
MKRLVTILMFLTLASRAFAQDSVAVVTPAQDTALIKSYAARYNPRKALLYAAVLPGLGQIYNKKYWKLPLVYGGFGSIGYGINFYQKGYKKYKLELFKNLENGYTDDSDINPETDYSTGLLRTFVDKYRRERDFMVILMGGMYILQIIDAHVDAHLKEFDLNPKLQVSIEPTLDQDALLGRQTGISVILKF